MKQRESLFSSLLSSSSTTAFLDLGDGKQTQQVSDLKKEGSQPSSLAGDTDSPVRLSRRIQERRERKKLQGRDESEERPEEKKSSKKKQKQQDSEGLKQ